MNRKHRKKSFRLNGEKLVVLIACISLALCSVIGGTLAWLITKTEPVVNTFTYGDINITLKEFDNNKDGDNNPNTNTYAMMPGQTISKDPTITFKANSENAWLFVELEKTKNFDDFMTYQIADGWTALGGADGVYYREVSKSDEDIYFTVLKDNIVTVKGEVTKEMLNALDANGASDYPKLTVTAYAVQRDSNIATAADAWAKTQPVNP